MCDKSNAKPVQPPIFVSDQGGELAVDAARVHLRPGGCAKGAEGPGGTWNIPPNTLMLWGPYRTLAVVTAVQITYRASALV